MLPFSFVTRVQVGATPRSPFTTLVCRLLSVAAALSAMNASVAAVPYDLLPLNKSSPNYAAVFSNVQTGSRTSTTDPNYTPFKAGHEMLSAVYAYLSPASPYFNQTEYRDRLFVLLDQHFGLWQSGEKLGDIGFAWQSCYAYMLMKHYRPNEISPTRKAMYEAAIALSNAYVLSHRRAVMDLGQLADLWLNGDIRMAKSVYFGATALGDTHAAAKAKNSIDTLMSRATLAMGGTRYVGFWGESPTYHDEVVRNYIYWWKITGSLATKQALDATIQYSVVANEPSGFVEQSSSIPYKHNYNNIASQSSSLWKAYIYNDGYNYYYGKTAETPTSTELLNTILYEPDRVTKVPSDNVGVFFDENIQGPRGRFGGSWGWVAHGRNVQVGGPEQQELTEAQGLSGAMVGKATFIGAYSLGPIANKTSLKGALDTVLVEFKSRAGIETDFSRGTRYRFLAQDEKTSFIVRKNFGTLSTSYRISSRTGGAAEPNWGSAASNWIGRQLWALTGERAIGIVQIENDATDTVYGLDARLVFVGGRHNVMGSYLPLERPDATSFEFGDLRVKIHSSTFAGATTQQRIAIARNADDNYSALVRVSDAAISGDAAVTFPAGTKRWLVIDAHRKDVADASRVINVLPNHSAWAVLQFAEGGRIVRIVQNLTGEARRYGGNFAAGRRFARASLHRSWSESVTPLDLVGGVAVVTETIPPFGHLIAVSSDQADDHANSRHSLVQLYP